MKLNESLSWDTPDDVVTTTFSHIKGKNLHGPPGGGHDMLVRGARDISMHKHPFTSYQRSCSRRAGRDGFQQSPMAYCLRRTPKRTLVAPELGCGQRYDLEHFFRFGKQRLLMGNYQTPETEHEENWWTIVQLAYIQLWIAREQARILPRPWKRYLPVSQKESTRIPSPSAVQMDMERIIRHFGKPAHIPNPRGKSFGRVAGQCRGRRTTCR